MLDKDGADGMDLYGYLSDESSFYGKPTLTLDVICDTNSFIQAMKRQWLDLRLVLLNMMFGSIGRLDI